MSPTHNSGGSEVITVDVHKAKELLHSANYAYLDVRTVEEYKKGHVDAPRIFNVPIMFNTPNGRVKNPDFVKEVRSLCKEDHHLIVGCQSGVRSVTATTDLLNAGYKVVKDMGGGYLSWVENGFSTKKFDDKPKNKSESISADEL